MEHKEPGITPDDLRSWQAAMGLTAPKAAAALGVSYATYRDWLAGVSRTTGRAIVMPPLLGLACAALAAGVPPIGENHHL